MNKHFVRVLSLVLLMALIGNVALAGSIDNVLSSVKGQGWKISQSSVKKAERYKLNYVETSKENHRDKLTWSSDKKAFTVTATKNADKVKLRQLYLDLIKLYKWKILSYKVDGVIQYGYNYKGAKSSYKSLSAYRKAVRTYVGNKATAAEQDPGSKGQQYVLNTNTKKFHKPSCRDVKRMSEKNKQVVTSTRSNIISQGYSPCGHCHP